MINNFIVNCKKCPIPTDSEMELFPDMSLLVICHGCGNWEYVYTTGASRDKLPLFVQKVLDEAKQKIDHEQDAMLARIRNKTIN